MRDWKPRFILRHIVREGRIVGYRCYKTGGIFGAASFYGYRWLK